MGILKKLLDSEYKELKRFDKLADEIISLEDSMANLKDEDFKNKTNEFKQKLKNGSSLDDILPEAFAVCREASKRVLGMRHFDVQLIGGIILHQGRIAVRMIIRISIEMKR